MKLQNYGILLFKSFIIKERCNILIQSTKLDKSKPWENLMKSSGT